jgi:hypothetical protein
MFLGFLPATSISGLLFIALISSLSIFILFFIFFIQKQKQTLPFILVWNLFLGSLSSAFQP